MEWNSFRKRRFPSTLLPFPYYFIEWNKEKSGFEMSKYLTICENGWRQDLIDKQSFEKIGNFLLTRIVEDYTLLKKSLYISKETAQKLIAFCRKNLTAEKLKLMGDEELLDCLDTFFRYYTKFSNENIPFWLFLSDAIANDLKKKNIQDELVMQLAAPEEPSYMARFELEFLHLVLKIRNEKISTLSADELMLGIRKNGMINNEFEELADKYFWVPFDYLGPKVYDKKALSEMILKNTLSIDELKQKITELRNAPFKTKEAQEKIIKEANFPNDLLYLFECLKILTIMTDNKKEFTNQQHYYLQNLIKEIAERANTNFMDIYHLKIPEIKEFLSIKRSIESRKNRSVHLFTPSEEDKISIFTGEEAERFLKENGLCWISEENIEEASIIKGTGVSVGKASGKARIILSLEEMNKLVKGEILVTTMTTPDFVPAMRKAAAIIAEEGGITSHAAIVSRELGIPCIIGAGNATKLIKDGDCLEVDAKMGIIKKVRENKCKEMQVKTEQKPETTRLCLSNKETAFFSEVSREDTPLVGGKGANLGELSRSFPVPSGFCVTVNAYTRFIKENNLKEEIAQILKTINIEDTQDLNQKSDKIQKLIMNSDIPESTKLSVAMSYSSLSQKRVAVRSSATSEDSPSASFAGQHATFLNISENSLIESIKKCWASLFSSRAIYYSTINGFHSEVSMSVVVQEMIDSEKSGVMFTANPITKRHDEIVIEASYGLGESIVSGTVSPDTYIIDKKKLAAKSTSINEKKTAVIKAESDGTDTIHIDAKNSNSQCLTEEEMRLLAEYALKIESHYKVPQDIEWAISKGKIHILQSRPITTL